MVPRYEAALALLASVGASSAGGAGGPRDAEGGLPRGGLRTSEGVRRRGVWESGRVMEGAWRRGRVRGRKRVRDFIFGGGLAGSGFLETFMSAQMDGEILGSVIGRL